MIDWVTMKIPCDHDGMICNGAVVKVNKDSEIEWTSMSYLPVVGSHESTISIRSVTESTLSISGNPAKWLQGHNLFGINDLKRLVWVFFNELLKIPELNLRPTMQQLALIKDGCYTVSRVDINETWLLSNRSEVLAWINSAGQKMRLKHRGAGQFQGDTLYWGKGSTRWFLKCYSKGDEINSKKSKYPDALRIPEMLDFADRSLRFEIQLSSTYLRETMLHMPMNWTAETAKMVLINALGKLEMSNNIRLSDAVLDSMPSNLKSTYMLWWYGEDMKQFLSKPTFYRRRSALKKYDIDIGIIRDTEKEDSKVIPLVKILEAQPAGIPDWAYEKGLIVA